ncbi:MAG: copper resistance protein B [Gemmatimonadaceae bacterium]|nr:copper resistance protein B [Gemmatimonadaceae bacterium]
MTVLLFRSAAASSRHGWRRSALSVVVAALLHLSLAAGRAAAQSPGMHGKQGAASMEMDKVRRTFLLADLLEYAPNGDDKLVRFEGLGWIGGDYNRLWLRAEGEQPTARGGGELDVEALYGRLVSPFWSALAGVRVDTRERGGNRVTRGLLALGFEGLAPYWFALEPTVFVSPKGDISARILTSFDLLFTQRFIIQPRLEMHAAVQKVPEFGVGSGLNDVALGARARYEVRRQFAPYMGVNWLRRTGRTASLARQVGEPVGDFSVVAGVRLWR